MLLPDYYGDERRAKRQAVALAACRYAIAGLAGFLLTFAALTWRAR